MFIIVLENKGFDKTFGPSPPATYLSRTLTVQGQLLRQYYGIGKSLTNHVAMVSGQGPNFVTQSDCLVYTNVLPGTQTTVLGQTLGQGCVCCTASKIYSRFRTSASLLNPGRRRSAATCTTRNGRRCAAGHRGRN